MRYQTCIFNAVGVLLLLSLAFSEEPGDLLTIAPAVYIDCEDCDLKFIKQEIPFVNHAIDRAVADVHILITTRETASEGIEHTLILLDSRGSRERMIRFVLYRKLKIAKIESGRHSFKNSS